ncbi:hypothetical protein E2P81_ATG01174 [Venturia nashicola]|nr:hypothetical protein E2P81_ATG01174 [Venturia nashicola]
MCFTFSTVVGSSRRSKSTTSSYDSSISSISSIVSKLDPVPAPSSAEWMSSGTGSGFHSHHDADRLEGQLALSETEHDLMMTTHQAVVDQRPRNRLSRQTRRQGDTAQRTSPLRPVQSPTDLEMDRQYQAHANLRPHDWVGPCIAPTVPPSPLISLGTSTRQQEPGKKSYFTPSSRPQHTSWMDKNPQPAADLREIQPNTKPCIDISSPTLNINKKRSAARTTNDSIHQKSPLSPSQTSTSSSSSSTPSIISTEATDPLSPRPTTTTQTSPTPPMGCPTFATTFNTMVIHHLRTQWPHPTSPLDIPTREEVLSLIYARLKRLPTSVGRDRVSVHDSEEDFIERRALVVAQGVRRDLIRDMGVRREKEERELKRDVEAARRYAGGER